MEILCIAAKLQTLHRNLGIILVPYLHHGNGIKSVMWPFWVSLFGLFQRSIKIYSVIFTGLGPDARIGFILDVINYDYDLYRIFAELALNMEHLIIHHFFSLKLTILLKQLIGS